VTPSDRINETSENLLFLRREAKKAGEKRKDEEIESLKNKNHVLCRAVEEYYERWVILGQV